MLDKIGEMCQGIDFKNITDIYPDNYGCILVVCLDKIFHICEVEDDGQKYWRTEKFLKRQEANEFVQTIDVS